MKTKLTFDFDLPEDQESFDTITKASAYKHALWRISQEVFRPHRKHGYNDAKLNELNEQEAVSEAIGRLERMFWEICNEEETGGVF